jgi:pimeloyl-ACP methyl ester carboxylesterase
MTRTGTVWVPGARLVYDEAGHGRPAVVFVHGGGCDRQNWSVSSADSVIDSPQSPSTYVAMGNRLLSTLVHAASRRWLRICAGYWMLY